MIFYDIVLHVGKTKWYIYKMDYRRTFLQALFIFCEDRNMDIYKLASLAGLSVNKLNSKSKFDVSNQQMENIWKNSVQFSNDELIGLHFGTAMQLAALNVVGQIIQTSSTIKDALQQVSSLIHLITDFYTMQIEEKPETFTVSFIKNEGYDDFPVSQKQMGDFLIAFALYEMKGLLLKNPKPLKIELPSYKKDNETEYEAILKCRVRKSENYKLEFKKEFLLTPIITANYEIQTLLLNQINQLQNPKELNGDFSKRIFNYLIANSYLYSLSMEAVAGNFNISVRTLQRKLKGEGVSYQQIVEEVRKSLAVHYIENSSSSVKEISIVLGYSEPSAFVRAFKKWTGKAPTTYKKEL